MSPISIIIPTLNEDKLLEGMLRQFTAERQQRFNLEIVVSDGGSTDATCAIARRYAHKVVAPPPGERQTIAMGRNAGAAAAHGELLVFLNADTLLADPDAFFAAIEREACDTSIVAWSCKVEVVPAERRLSDRLYHGFYNWFFGAMNSVGMAMGRGECHVIRRTAFQSLHGYDMRIAAGEDYDMFRRLQAEGRVVFMRDVIVYESPRRYRRFGYLYVTGAWFLNFLSVFLLHRSISQQWKAVR